VKAAVTYSIGSHVLALCALSDDDGAELCAPGDRGFVQHVEPDGVPMVRFLRTGRASLVDGDSEIVRCELADALQG
jgi:hypothetical protein